MKKRIVKLTETDLEKLVKLIIKEEDSEMSQGLEKKTDKIIDMPAFSQLVKTIKSKNVDEQISVIMTLLKQMDLKGNFGAKFKEALKTLN